MLYYNFLFMKECLSYRLNIKYNEVDDSETRDFRFLDNGILYLVYADHQIIQYDEYTREENIPESAEKDTES